jgi:hypothetical protein
MKNVCAVHRVSRDIVRFASYARFDSRLQVNLDGVTELYRSRISLVIKIYDPENRITKVNQILDQMMIWRTQDGEILTKVSYDDENNNQLIPENGDIKIKIQLPSNKMAEYPPNITLEIEYKEKPYPTTDILDNYILIEDNK